MRTSGPESPRHCRQGLPWAWVLGLSLLVAACGPEAEAPPASESSAAAVDAAGQGSREVAVPSWREERWVLGKATYQEVCAACHDTGEGGAPRIGRKEDWEDRSELWQAVLFNHAKSGWLDMPARGGRPELSDEEVEAAAEYMLNITFPDLPGD